MAAVLVPVVREAVTNILKHSSASYCTLEMTADARLLQLSISNDGSGDGSDDTGSGDAGSGPAASAEHAAAGHAAAGHAGNGLRNLAARLEAAGGRQTATRGDGTFSLAVELPLVEAEPVG